MMHSSSTLTSIKHLAKLSVLVWVTIACSLPSLHAQPSLNFKRVTVNWPTIELYFVADCDGREPRNMTKQDFRIYENGTQVEDFTLWCDWANPPHIPISVSLVIDVSGSMAGLENPGTRSIAHAFSNLMDGIWDEAAIIAFNNEVSILQPMTTDKTLLHAAADMLGSSGDSATVWDGAYVGLEELSNNGGNQLRTMILVTDGNDSGSIRSISDVISQANRNRIRIFILGLGPAVNSGELQQLALLTGGKYYQDPDANQLAAIYGEISASMMWWDQECIITYERNCTDGSLRTVELQLVDFCGGTDSKTKTYRAPLDTSSFSELYMKLGEEECNAGQQVTVPLNMSNQADTALFRPLTFTLRFDKACLEFIGISTPSHSLLAGVPVIATPVTGGVDIRTVNAIQSCGEVLLMEFEFRARDLLDTTFCKLEVVNAAFDQGCLRPIVEAGGVRIIPAVVNVNTPPDPTFLLTVHPEPNDGAFTVSIQSQTNEKARIHLFDMLGRRVYEQEYQ